MERRFSLKYWLKFLSAGRCQQLRVRKSEATVIRLAGATHTNRATYAEALVSVLHRMEMRTYASVRRMRGHHTGRHGPVVSRAKMACSRDHNPRIASLHRAKARPVCGDALCPKKQPPPLRGGEDPTAESARLISGHHVCPGDQETGSAVLHQGGEPTSARLSAMRDGAVGCAPWRPAPDACLVG